MLMDMEGKWLHKWQLPESVSTAHTVELGPGGDLYAIYGLLFSNSFSSPEKPLPKGSGLLRLGWDSNVRWQLKGHFSHDMVFAGESRLLVIESDPAHEEDRYGLPFWVIDAGISVISAADGKKLDSVSILERYADQLTAEQVQASRSGFPPGDLLHPNSLALLPRDSPLGRKGDWLVSLRNTNSLMVLDQSSHQRKWLLDKAPFAAQHEPGFLPDGNLLLFDNAGLEGASRVIEFDPVGKRIVWQYPEQPGQLYSAIRGGVQRLPNGNTLVVESDQGRAIEVTRQGEIVWEYYTPLKESDQGQRMAPYRMQRLTPEQTAALPWTPAERENLRQRGYLQPGL